MKNKLITSITIFIFICGNLLAQNQEILSKTKIQIETGKGKNLKTGNGYFFILELTKDKTNYSSVLVTRKLIENQSEIRLIFKPEILENYKSNKPYILTIPNNSDFVIQNNQNSSKFAIIPFYLLNKGLEKVKVLASPIFMNKESLPKIEISKNEIENLEKLWESKL